MLGILGIFLRLCSYAMQSTSALGKALQLSTVVKFQVGNCVLEVTEPGLYERVCEHFVRLMLVNHLFCGKRQLIVSSKTAFTC